jgi:von Hippel-Lindau disease tumor supressor
MQIFKLLLLTVALSAFSLTAPLAFAQTKLPQELRGVRSLNSDVQAAITFQNDSAQTVKIYWLGFKGERVFYQRLLPGETYQQETFLTHPWVVTDDKDNAWALHYAQRKMLTISIAAPPKPPAEKPLK